jgi:putative sterol carrier protein
VTELATPEANPPADFVISAKPEIYASLMRKELNPTAAMALGRVKVKGKQTILLKNMKRFSYLLDTLCDLDPIYN